MRVLFLRIYEDSIRILFLLSRSNMAFQFSKMLLRKTYLTYFFLILFILFSFIFLNKTDRARLLELNVQKVFYRFFKLDLMCLVEFSLLAMFLRRLKICRTSSCRAALLSVLSASASWYKLCQALRRF